MSDKSEARRVLWALRSKLKLTRLMLQTSFNPSVTSKLWKAEQELTKAEHNLASGERTSGAEN